MYLGDDGAAADGWEGGYDFGSLGGVDPVSGKRSSHTSDTAHPSYAQAGAGSAAEVAALRQENQSLKERMRVLEEAAAEALGELEDAQERLAAEKGQVSSLKQQLASKEEEHKQQLEQLQVGDA